MIKKIIFIFFLNLIFCSSSVKSNTLSGIELKLILENWLNEKKVQSNINILEQVKYPGCDESNIIINDISGTFRLIKISCIKPHEWSLIVRNKVKKNQNLRKKSHNTIDVFALNKPKKKGSIINEEDIIEIKKKLPNNTGLVLSKNDLIGKKLSKSMSANRALYHTSLKKDWLIEKDAIVLIENNQPYITIRAKGVALENADFGEKLRVKNLKSGKGVYGFAENKKKNLLNAKQN